MPENHTPDPAPPDGGDFTEQLLGRCLEQPEAEWRAELERVCVEHPVHAATLRRRFEALMQMGLASDAEPPAVNDDADQRELDDLVRDQPGVAAILADAVGARDAVPELADVDPNRGRVIANRYELDARLGAGSMGIVYRAQDRELGRHVAIKFVDSKLFADAATETRFMRESEALAALAHPNVVTVFDRGTTESGELFLVMELLRGASLRDVLAIVEERNADNAGEVDVDLAQVRTLVGCSEFAESTFLRLVVRWIVELARGLGAAHQRGVFHRDVKPSNVHIDENGHALLLDFGIAARAGDAELTATRSILGTPWYMAPEQAIGRAAPAPPLDVYSLVSTLYHLLTGQPPFGGDPLEVLTKLTIDDPPAAISLRPDLPRDLAAIIDRGTEKDPRRRYQSMAELEQDLVAFLEHRPVSARPLTRIGRFARRVRRRPARTIAVVASAIAVVLLPLLFWTWSAQAAHAMASARDEKMRHLPALLAFEGRPEQRMLVPVDERNGYIEALDEILEIDPDDVPTRLWRAALYLDKGQHASAARDLDELSRRHDSPYIRAVAARYRDANSAKLGTQAVDLANLGATPSKPEEWFIAGFHELRNRHIEGFTGRAVEALDRAKDAYLPARDLRLIAWTQHAEFHPRKERVAMYDEAYKEALRLEGIYGQPTARTCAIRGLAQIRLRKYKQAIAPLKQSLELRPDRHGPLTNLGVAYRRVRDLERARAALARAHELRPFFANTQFTLAQVLKDQGEFERAYEVAAAVPLDGFPGANWRQPFLLADIRLSQLIVAFAERRNDVPALAERATRAFETVATLAPKSQRARIEQNKWFASALGAGDHAKAASRLLASLAKKPDNVVHMGNLASLLAEVPQLGPEDLAHLREFLLALGRAIDPANPLLEVFQQAASSKHR